MERNYMTVAEVASYIRVSKDLIYKMVRQSEIPHIKIGERRIRFQLTSIDQWLQDQERR